MRSGDGGLGSVGDVLLNITDQGSVRYALEKQRKSKKEKKLGSLRHVQDGRQIRNANRLVLEEDSRDCEISIAAVLPAIQIY